MIDPVCLAEAGAALARREWAAAVAAYERAGLKERLSPGDGMKRNLAANFAALAVHRPEVMRLLDGMPTDGRFQIGVMAQGRATVCFQGRPLTIGEDPVAALNAALKQLMPARSDGRPLGIFGTSDGYLLVALARHPIPLQFGREQPVHLLEPNPANLVAAMMIHDYSGEDGPIRQKRFHWYVGSDCVKQFRAAYIERPEILFPELHISSEPSGMAIGAELAQVFSEVLAMDKALAAQVSAMCEGITLERLVDMTSRKPSRQPRALLITSRFSTVLQYSTADLAQGLRELGWHTETMIEESAHHCVTIPGLRKAVLRNDPDLVIQLDHLRREHGSVFPPNLPFVCWAQDHLPNLCDVKAGRSMGERDFFMTCLGDWFVREYAYPPESIVAAAKFTKVPEIPADWESDGHDLTYVSNASALPEEGVREYAKRFEGVAQDIAVAAAGQVIAAYGEGRAFYGPSDLTPIVEREAWLRGIASADLPGELTVDLFERVNNLCYRQQALGWVANVADELGLDLAIYGAGWEKHPRFAKYARGHVQYGPALEKLTRASKINLQIVPYFCLHQRLLDGIAAGGFFLVRSHVSDSALPALCEYVEKHVPADVRTYTEARQRLSAEVLAGLDEHAAANSHLEVMLDVIQQARNAKAMGLFPGNRPMPDRIEEVSFGSAAEFRTAVLRYLADAKLRREIAMQQRASTLEVLSYAAGIRRVLDSIHEKLAARAKGLRAAA